jgi:hypothetical protein
MVNALETDNQRLGKLIFDLARLDEALMQRVHTLASTQYNDPMAIAMMANFVDLLTTVSSFINMAMSVPDDRAATAATIYNDLMKRIKEKQ